MFRLAEEPEPEPDTEAARSDDLTLCCCFICLCRQETSGVETIESLELVEVTEEPVDTTEDPSES